MPNISAGSSEIAKSGFTTNQYTKRKGAGKTVSPNTIVDEKYLLAWYDFMDRETLWKDAAGILGICCVGDRIGRIDNKAYTLGEDTNKGNKFGAFARTFAADGAGGPTLQVNEIGSANPGGCTLGGNTYGAFWDPTAGAGTTDAGLISSAAAGFGAAAVDGSVWSRVVTNTGAMTSFYVFSPWDKGPTGSGTTQDWRVVAVANNSSGGTYYEDEFDVGHSGGFPGKDDTRVNVVHSNGAANTLLASNSVGMNMQACLQIWTVEQGSESVVGSPNDQYYMYKSGSRTIGTSGTTSKLQAQNHGGGWMEFGVDCTDNVCTGKVADTVIHGFVHEVIVYNKILSKAELNDVHNYLLDKYQCYTTPLPFIQGHRAGSATYYGDGSRGGPNLWANMLAWYDFTDTSRGGCDGSIPCGYYWFTESSTGGPPPPPPSGGHLYRVFNKAIVSNCQACTEWNYRWGIYLRAHAPTGTTRPRWYGNGQNGKGYVKFGVDQEATALLGGYFGGTSGGAETFGGISATQFNQHYLGTGFTIIMVCKSDETNVTGGGDYLIDFRGNGLCGGTSNRFYIKVNAGDEHLKCNLLDYSCGTTGTTLDSGEDFGTGHHVVMVEVRQGTDETKLYIDNVLKDTTTVSATAIVSLAGAVTEGTMALGGQCLASTLGGGAMLSQLAFKGRIYEVHMYGHGNNITLHANQKEYLRMYFNWKYGFNL